MMPSIRSLLFVPATRSDLVGKVPRMATDAVVIDLEDTVPEAEKSRARGALQEQFELLRSTDERGTLRCLRTNPVGTEGFHADMFWAGLESVDAVLVPKVSSPSDIEQIMDARDGVGRPDLPVILGIETVLGVGNVEELAAAPVAGLYFGADDFVAGMGGRRTSGGTEILYARSRVALAARLGGIVALDHVVFDVRAEAVFRENAETGRAMGYTGKMCVHPRQVEWANRAFSPTVDEVVWARRVLAAYAESESRGQGVALIDDAIVDMPAVRRARRLVSDAERFTSATH